MPRGLTSKDPVVDPVKAWHEGVDALPTMAERLAEDLQPELAPGQRELTPKEQLAFFGQESPGQHQTHQYGEQNPPPPTDAPDELEAGPEDPSPVAPKVSELLQPDELANFKVPAPDEGGVLPVEVAREFQDALDRQEQAVEQATLARLVVPADLSPPPEYLQDKQVAQVCPGGHESPAGAKFCMECGESFSVATETPAEWHCGLGHKSAWAAKFCMECGAQRPDLIAPVTGAGLAVEMAMRPAPEAELTPAARAERERLHAAALRLGREDPGVVYSRPSGQQPTVLFHVLKSGWTFAGQVWMRGQEIELEQGTPRWAEAQRFINWSDAEQYEQYGRLCWRLGPWPGRRSYTQVEPGSYQRLGPLSKNGQEVLGPTEEMLRRADEMEAQRGRGVPQPLFVRMRG
jgi:hypothetical protein